MVFDPETAYKSDYAHIGTLAKAATFTPKDAGGQGSATYAVQIAYGDISTADFASGNISPGTTDTVLIFWAAGSGAPVPGSGDLITVSGTNWIILSVGDSRRGSWRLTVRNAVSNVIGA